MKKITIFYDYDAFYRDHKFGGIARCFIELMKHLKCNYFLSVKYSLLYYISEILPTVNDFSSVTFRGKARIRKLLNQIYTYWNLVFKKYDIVHFTGEKLYATWIINKPIVVTMHDCVLEKFFNNGERADNRLKIMQKADHIIAVSENTKKDLLYYYPEIPAEKISVIYHGYSGFAESKGTNQWGRYVLNVGMRQTYKNYKNLLKAMVYVVEKDEDIKLISAGKPFDSEELAMIQELGLDRKVVSVQCSDDLLADLYNYAQAFIYPSLYEGFGITILEAWSFGTPVVLSDIGCFHEVAEDAGAYFNPKDPKDMSEKIYRVISDPFYAKNIVNKGYRRLNQFTWEKSADNHLKIYQGLLK